MKNTLKTTLLLSMAILVLWVTCNNWGGDREESPTTARETSVVTSDAGRGLEEEAMKNQLMRILEVIRWARDEYPVPYVRERLQLLDEQMQQSQIQLALYRNPNAVTAGNVRWTKDGTAVILMEVGAVTEADEVIGDTVMHKGYDPGSLDAMVIHEELFRDYVVYMVTHELVHWEHQDQVDMGVNEHRDQESRAYWEVFERVVVPGIREGRFSIEFDKGMLYGIRMYLLARGETRYHGWQEYIRILSDGSSDFSCHRLVLGAWIPGISGH